jgi:aspartyl-tRNA(Asn)/glutamyl-tRNA(Gln) amidotransferase subunit A
MTDLAYLSARDLVSAYRDRTLSPVETVTATLDRAEALQTRLNAFITICREDALAAARATEAAPEPLGPLHGVPFSVKDLILTKGVRTTRGSKAFADFVPEVDAVAVARMKAAGAILIGKTTTPEFGHGPLTEAPLFGRTANAWDKTRTSGGSSGGGAAAVAAGIGPLAVTTDGGGSIRIPAACNGVVGMKQTRGLVPDAQIRDAFNSTALTGPTTRTVADNALMLSVLAGPHPLDPNSYGRALADVVSAVEAPGDLSGLRVAWRPTMGNTVVDEDVLAGTEMAARRFADFGATVFTMDDDLTDQHGDWLLASNAHWESTFGPLLAEHRDELTPAVVAAIESVQGVEASALQRANDSRTDLFRRIQGWFDDADLILTPTLTRTAIPIDAKFNAPLEIADQPIGPLRQSWYPYTYPFNLSGHPAITVPGGFASDGLPYALQIVGPLMRDDLVYRAAALFERAQPWADRRPDM